MPKNGDISKIRINNKRAMLRHIRQNGQVSRVQLAQSLRLSKSTVTENMSQLLQNGVVLETGVGSSQVTGGRRPVMLRINSGFSYIVAAELGLHSPIFALADLNGKLLLRRAVNLPEDAPYAHRLRLCKETIRLLLREGKVMEKDLGIIALSSPGAYSRAEGAFQLNPEFLNWNVDQLTKDLETTFHTEVFRMNDVNAATLGEFHQGAGRVVKSLLFLSCGTGVGYGMVLNGRLYEGMAGSAGEVARSRVAGGGGEPLRTQVELNALVDKVRKHAPEATRLLLASRGGKIDFPAVVWLWEQEDEFVRDSVQQIALILGEATAFALSMLNCELVVFGGDFLVFEDHILPVMNDVIRREAFDPVRVVPSALRQDAGIQGLLNLAADTMLDRIATQRP